MEKCNGCDHPKGHHRPDCHILGCNCKEFLGEPWGYKYNVSFYIPGEAGPGAAIAIVNATEKAVEVLQDQGLEVDFAGASMDNVQHKPRDQGGS